VTIKLLVIGGGFGVYGYLPAAISNGWEVSTLLRYQAMMQERPELVGLLSRVNFINESEIDVALYDAIAVARNPETQFEFVSKHSNFRGHYFLEKPLGATATKHHELLDLLKVNGISFSIAYLFKYQVWYQEIIRFSTEPMNCKVRWGIEGPPVNSWKSDNEQGGGLITYYGVHFLELLFEIGFNAENISFHEIGQGIQLSAANHSAQFEIELVDDRSDMFSVEFVSTSKTYHWKGFSPFGDKPKSGVPDSRLASLSAYLDENIGNKGTGAHIVRENQILLARAAFEAQMAEKHLGHL
jgi:hypothetical protein